MAAVLPDFSCHVPFLSPSPIQKQNCHNFRPILPVLANVKIPATAWACLYGTQSLLPLDGKQWRLRAATWWQSSPYSGNFLIVTSGSRFVHAAAAEAASVESAFQVLVGFSASLEEDWGTGTTAISLIRGNENLQRGSVGGGGREETGEGRTVWDS